MKVFFDTNLFIYLWEEGDASRAGPVQRILRAIGGSGDSLVTSTLTLGEILVHPMRNSEDDAVRAYLERFQRLELVSFDAGCAALFAGVRARLPKIRAPDAIQLACAARVECAWFLTNDRRLSGVHVPGVERCASYLEFPVG